MIKRHECSCMCHNDPLIIHMSPCCEEDRVEVAQAEVDAIIGPLKGKPMTDQCKINCDADTFERLINDAIRDEREENAKLRSALEYLQLNFPANKCLQDKCREVLGKLSEDKTNAD